MDVAVEVPERFLGDIISDLNGKRGKVSRTEAIDEGWQRIEAVAPQAELQRFSLDLRSITQGRGRFHMSFSHFEALPHQMAQILIDKFGKDRHDKD